MPNFWPACLYDASTRNADGSTAISEAFLRSLWQRPEVAPVEESCRHERALHTRLLADPAQIPDVAQIAAIADSDARENYQVLSAFIVRLRAAACAEDAWRGIFNEGNVAVAPMFIDLLVELILRNLLDSETDAQVVRAAELLFRPQKVSIQQGVILLADAGRVGNHASGAAFGELGKLLVEARIKPRNISLDVLNETNGARFWDRSGSHDTVLSFQHGGQGLDGFCRVLEKWVGHFFSMKVSIHSIASIDAKDWAWHIGLDAQATAMLNDLYLGKTLAPERRRRLLALFEMDAIDSSALRPEIAGRPIYLACAMTDDDTLRIKPQNLLLNMPVA